MKKKPWKRLSQSDSEAVMRLVDEYQSSIKRIIVSVLKGQWPDAVDDILQDTYEEICRQLNLIEEAENRRAYVCKIAARLAIQAHRRLGRDLPLDEDVPAPEDLSFNLDTILPCSLSPSDKRLLKRVYEEQDNIVDIAKEFGKKDTALRQQLKRARDRVKKIIITWKDELFGTVPHIPGTMELKEPNVSGYRSLKEAVQKYTDISVVPGWIPPGYTIDEIYEMEVESADVISATYRDGQKSIVIRVFCYRNTEDISDLWVEKDSGLYKDTYQTHGIEHAISENYGHTQIMWRNGQCTCSITGDISRADAERMINSIYENGG